MMAQNGDSSIVAAAAAGVLLLLPSCSSSSLSGQHSVHQEDLLAGEVGEGGGRGGRVRHPVGLDAHLAKVHDPQGCGQGPVIG